MRNKKGFTLVELMIVVAISSIIGFSAIYYFKNAFVAWWTISDQLKVQGEARNAIDEMSRFIRQSSSPVTGIYPALGQGSTSYISFVYVDSSGNKNMTYQRQGDSLYRIVDGVSHEIIAGGLENIYFAHTSSYVVTISSMSVNFGEGSINLDKTIFLRNQ